MIASRLQRRRFLPSHTSVVRAHIASTMADSVTQLQEHINMLSQMMYDYAGRLQRDAKPVSRVPAPDLRFSW